ncbi:ABC exporter membrane fusion protein [Umezakia ovalisporum]|jgi:HlyD family secretion protein|uniref:ABC exporter membrane fusion protein n=2 Tax=Umezakia ovalisporum TaxID=75695 RepID=A0AA43KG45_9CYAN|nr:ABC exporter membrane fusion protein [Umezakia ovalisporum]MBI1243275.1 HlyD family efflux transporter periplasmic adaptor subunit [Nostoc sp. RI_552]MDH6058141.1 ABC exporter membrane fusion protein [Umezakia ovalisporum FSS-43]MDH6065291.1 ABC exporter membrane fusion protein [Umezakia ovalisporum FSS-62]MDH6066283.1 ABC exporter membrane fusion protein [Umezakia ovalisporum APH033B]MDH6071842.1 ABC exporter membrane fusion protein [Umezakia ovalisporum CobakiLakeA]
MVTKQRQLFTKPVSQWSIILAISIAVTTGAISVSRFAPNPSTSTLEPPIKPTSAPNITTVAALGRLEPQGEVIRLSAANSQAGVRVSKLLVAQGDWVSQGDVVAILDNYDTRLAALEKAKKQVLVAQANLNQVKAGAKAGDISAQQATIARLEAELKGEVSTQQARIARLEAESRNAESENQRYQKLFQEGAISASSSETKQLRVDTVRQQLNEAKAAFNRTVETLQKQLKEAEARLESIAEVRPTDIQAAQTDVDSAIASVKQAQADWNLSLVRSPIDGQVLKINTRPGEIINNSGIVELGSTQQMYVVAEVYETDIQKVRLGQSAIITSNALAGELRGKVTDIGLRVNRQNIFDLNPQVNTDNKVVDVKIRLDHPPDNQQVTTLTDLQVQVLINI